MPSPSAGRLRPSMSDQPDGAGRAPIPGSPGVRPERVVLVCGTGTEVGKTWVGSRCSLSCGTGACRWPPANLPSPSTSTPTGAGSVAHRCRGVGVGIRRGARRGVPAVAVVSPGHGSADGGRGSRSSRIHNRRPGRELAWPPERVEVGVVETAGGVRSPQASDGDAIDLLALLRPDAVVLVADAGSAPSTGSGCRWTPWPR